MGGGNRARIDDVAEESAVVVGHLPDFEVFHETGVARGVDRTAVDDVPGKGPAAPHGEQVDGYGGVVRGREGPAVADVAGKQRGADFLNVNAIAAAGKKSSPY